MIERQQIVGVRSISVEVCYLETMSEGHAGLHSHDRMYSVSRHIGLATTLRYEYTIMIKLRYSAKQHIKGDLIYVLAMRKDERWMHLEDVPSRALRKGEIHELIVTPDKDLRPGSGVRDVAYIGFFEVKVSGIAETGDEVWAGEYCLGTLAGFDMTHFPNHLNIVVQSLQPRTGTELGLGLGAMIRFDSPQGAEFP